MKIPKVSTDIYVPTIKGHFAGSLARVVKVIGKNKNHRIITEEHDGANYAWENGIQPLQEELRKQFANGRAYSTGIPLACPIIKKK